MKCRHIRSTCERFSLNRSKLYFYRELQGKCVMRWSALNQCSCGWAKCCKQKSDTFICFNEFSPKTLSTRNERIMRRVENIAIRSQHQPAPQLRSACIQKPVATARIPYTNLSIYIHIILVSGWGRARWGWLENYYSSHSNVLSWKLFFFILFS